jgi:hypothetical protein
MHINRLYIGNKIVTASSICSIVLKNEFESVSLIPTGLMFFNVSVIKILQVDKITAVKRLYIIAKATHDAGVLNKNCNAYIFASTAQPNKTRTKINSIHLPSSINAGISNMANTTTIGKLVSK